MQELMGITSVSQFVRYQNNIFPRKTLAGYKRHVLASYETKRLGY